MIGKEAEALGRRLVACAGFRWMPGMLDSKKHRVLSEYSEASQRIGAAFADSDIAVPGDADHACLLAPKRHHMGWPDLRDPATLGCVLALVRERWPLAFTRYLKVNTLEPGKLAWDVDVGDGPGSPGYANDYPQPTEAEALVAALEAAR